MAPTGRSPIPDWLSDADKRGIGSPTFAHLRPSIFVDSSSAAFSITIQVTIQHRTQLFSQYNCTKQQRRRVSDSRTPRAAMESNVTKSSLATTTHPRLGWIGQQRTTPAIYHQTHGPRLISTGLGSMGFAMAANLQKHLQNKKDAPSLCYTNRTLARGEPLQALGAIACATVLEVVQRADIIFLSLSDDAALETIIDAIIASADISVAGKIVVDTSTVHPAASAKAAARLAEKGASFIAAPVFGASPVAARGQVLFVLAGPNDAVEAISPFLVGVMGRGVIKLGEDVQKASMLKTAGNFITAAMMEVVAEAHVFAEKTGLGSEAMESLIEQQYGPLALSMSQRLTTGAYMPARGDRPWSDLNLALKDVGHGITCAEQAGSKLEVADLALGHLQEAKRFSDANDRPLDSSSMYGVLRKNAGLPFETELVKQRDGQQ